MATNVNFEAFPPGPQAGGKVTAVISLNDVSVNTTVNASGGFNTATVTADKQRAIFIPLGDASGMPSGWYDCVTPPGGSNLFRLKA